MILSILPGGAAQRIEPLFCVTPLLSAMYESVPQKGFAGFALEGCLCFFVLLISGFMMPTPRILDSPVSIPSCLFYNTALDKKQEKTFFSTHPIQK
jgi:hypothetical protein